jgi:hypothetical protein
MMKMQEGYVLYKYCQAIKYELSVWVPPLIDSEEMI